MLVIHQEKYPVRPMRWILIRDTTRMLNVGRRERIEILAKLRCLIAPLRLQSVKSTIGNVSALKPHEGAPKRLR